MFNTYSMQNISTSTLIFSSSVSFLVFCVSQYYMHKYFQVVGVNKALRAQISLNPLEVYDIFVDWKSHGLLDAYRASFDLDMFHPLFFSVFMSIYITTLCRLRSVHLKKYFFVLSMLPGVLDIVENFVHLTFIEEPTKIISHRVLFFIGNGCANMKWILVLVYIFLVSFMLFDVIHQFYLKRDIRHFSESEPNEKKKI